MLAVDNSAGTIIFSTEVTMCGRFSHLPLFTRNIVTCQPNSDGVQTKTVNRMTYLSTDRRDADADLAVTLMLMASDCVIDIREDRSDTCHTASVS
jgi:hypothetical protein